MRAKISFFSKSKITCLVCSHEFNVEKILSKQGRLNSVGLSNDLRRIYQPTKKYGNVYPLIYHLIVCPECWFAALPEDFKFDLKKPSYDLKKLSSFSEVRKKQAKEFFKEIDFNQARNLENGLISYFLAISSYQHYKNPSLKIAREAVLSLRSSWVIDDLLASNHSDAEKLKYLKEYFRFFAYKKFNSYFELMYSVKKKFIEVNYHGLDIDYDYGYKSFLYIHSFLNFEFIDSLQIPNQEKLNRLNKIKFNIAKIFGLGKSSKKNPSILLEKSRIFYEFLKKKIATLET